MERALRVGRRSAAFSLLAATALASFPAFSQSFSISPGQTAGPQTMNDAGDTGKVAKGGTISTATPGGMGVRMLNGNQTLSNDGTIATTGDGGVTVSSEGDKARITNNGLLRATGADSVGIFSSGAAAVIANDGRIEATNDGIAGILSIGQDAKATNTGTITTGGPGSFGMLMLGDGAQLDNSGTISASGAKAFGAAVQGAGAKLTNSGSIAVSGASAMAISSIGADASITNSGKLTTTGDTSVGIEIQGAGTQVKNTGAINADGLASFGILVDGANGVSVTTSGSISVNGDGSSGVLAAGNGFSISNGGSIRASGSGVTGVLVDGADAHIANSGSIDVSGDGAAAVNGGSGDNLSVRNSGRIVASGAGASGILAAGDHASVTNSGTLLSDSIAIGFGGDDARLTLLAGTAIQGEIGFLGAGNTVSFGSGLNAVMTFSGNFPETILTGGQPFVVDGSTVAVLDPAGFGGARAVVTDLTGNIAGAIEDRLAATRDGTGGVALDLRGNHGAGIGEGGSASTGLGPAFWATAIGGYRKQDGSDGGVGFHHSLGGVLIGVDTDLSDYWRGGVFLGASGGSVRVDGSAQDIDHRSFFGGGYLGYAAGLNFADLSVSVGSLRQDSDRRIANNMVVGGIETAHAKSDGVFVSPAVTFGTHMAMGDTIVIPSLRLRYAGLFLDGYSETGGSDALSVRSRDVHIFEARGQIALPLTPMEAENGVWSTTLRAGIDGIANSGGRVSATLLGQDIVFTPAGNKGVIRGFAGADFNFVTTGRTQFHGTVEAGYGSDKAFTAVARAELSIPF